MELHNLKPAKGSVKTEKELLVEEKGLKKEVHLLEDIKVRNLVQDIQKR